MKLHAPYDFSTNFFQLFFHYALTRFKIILVFRPTVSNYTFARTLVLAGSGGSLPKTSKDHQGRRPGREGEQPSASTVNINLNLVWDVSLAGSGRSLPMRTPPYPHWLSALSTRTSSPRVLEGLGLGRLPSWFWRVLANENSTLPPLVVPPPDQDVLPEGS